MDNYQPLLGIWKLVSYEVEIQETGEIIYTMGKSPSGFACFTKNNHVMVTLTGDDRKVARNDQERVYLLNTIVSYAGTYRIDGNDGGGGGEQATCLHAEGAKKAAKSSSL